MLVSVSKYGRFGLCCAVAVNLLLSCSALPPPEVDPDATDEAIVVTFPSLPSVSDDTIVFRVAITNTSKSILCIPNRDNRDFVSIFRASDKAWLGWDIGDTFDQPYAQAKDPGKLRIKPMQTIRIQSIHKKSSYGYFSNRDGSFAGRQSGSEVLVGKVEFPYFPCNFSSLKMARISGVAKFVASDESAEFTY